tara:strand:+ start:469 stop:711 length:243 start_codon:yes stop_codon:yes gene_type:complete
MKIEKTKKYNAVNKFIPTELQDEARIYCVNSGYYVSPFQKNFKLYLNVNGIDETTEYKSNEIWEEMYKAYEQHYTNTKNK